MLIVMRGTDLENNCAGVTCENGGTCVDGAGSYTCECVRGWGGDLCEDGKMVCGSLDVGMFGCTF